MAAAAGTGVKADKAAGAAAAGDAVSGTGGSGPAAADAAAAGAGAGTGAAAAAVAVAAAATKSRTTAASTHRVPAAGPAVDSEAMAVDLPAAAPTAAAAAAAAAAAGAAAPAEFPPQGHSARWRDRQQRRCRQVPCPPNRCFVRRPWQSWHLLHHRWYAPVQPPPPESLLPLPQAAMPAALLPAARLPGALWVAALRMLRPAGWWGRRLGATEPRPGAANEARRGPRPRRPRPPR
mmetsp:Transcript_130729/g.419313  ORF Transcript_130729/g.419313 Transcript_130729/m.419313 type:complete len:235 (-) Transcript_130729:664-1368(-)